MSSPVECPVCHIFFASSVISAHVNSCLNDNEEDKEQVPHSQGKKRQCGSGWEFLNPSKSKKVIEPSRPNLNPTVKHRKSHLSGSSSSGVKIKPISDERLVINCDIDSDSEEENLNKKITCTERVIESTGKQDKRGLLKKNEHAGPFIDILPKYKPKPNQCTENKPLAAKIRPCDLEHFVGQSQAIKKNSLLYNILSFTENVPSMILWGPPGCGKTTLATIVGKNCKQHGKSKFVSMSATSTSVSDVKQVANLATNDMKMLRRNTILFLDEIHRFNKLQQDTLLPYVENGTLTLIGATTENPSFHVNSALLSRCRVIVLEKLSIADIKTIVTRALAHLGVTMKTSDSGLSESNTSDCKDQTTDLLSGKDRSSVMMEEDALDMLAGLTDGDARTALNSLQLAWEGCLAQAKETDTQGVKATITTDIVKEALQRSHILYDKTGEEHYNTVSAMIKSLRGSDADAALYWMVRMLEGGENPLFIARRLVIFASEDIGLADPMALTQAVSTHQACHILGMPECALNLTHCVLYLAQASKSACVMKSLTAARNCIRQHQGPLPSVPLHLRNSSTKFQDDLGYAKGYKYPPDFDGQVKQDYLPPCLKGMKFVPP